MIRNHKNAKAEKMLTTAMFANMSFRKFAETVDHEWQKDAGVQAEQVDESSGRKMMTRDVNSGHWVLKRRET